MSSVEALAVHELSLMRNVLDIVNQHAQGRRVQRVRLAVGELSCVMPEALNFCFESVRKGTVMAQAELEIDRVAGRARCLDCAREFAMPVTGARCECGSWRCRLLEGEDLRVIEMELEELG